ncbi:MULTISPECIES: hypothetical protein [Streptomyces]|uniref:LPXTG cell wall anchor domain-containing protein n=1 Tax=Streptomyces luteosporeus TaxID=173856 RepID=A0ABN3UA30_9ACTN
MATAPGDRPARGEGAERPWTASDFAPRSGAALAGALPAVLLWTVTGSPAPATADPADGVIVTASAAFTVTGTRDASARDFCVAPRAEQDALPDTTAGEPVTHDSPPGVSGGTALTAAATFLVLGAVAWTAWHRYRRRSRP